MLSFISAIMIAALSITSGVNDVVVAGGMESMSNAPKYLVQSRLVFDQSFNSVLVTCSLYLWRKHKDNTSVV